MKILTKIKRVLLSFAVLTALWSCTKDSSTPIVGGTGDDAEVKIVLTVPAASSTGSRALVENTHDAEVNEVVVMQFTTEGTNEITGESILKFATKSSSKLEQVGNRLTFNVKLLTGNYHIVVLANSGDIYDAVKAANGDDLREKTYDQLQKLFKKEVKGEDPNHDGDKWNTDLTQKKYHIPMWGIKSKVLISHDVASQTVENVYLYRMLAKVDVTVQREFKDGYGVSMQDFQLTYVSFHNYNRTGFVMPKLDNGDWEAENSTDRKATAPTLLSPEDKVTGHDHRQAWTTMTDPYNALKGEIFTFEASAGTDLTNRACIIIGGYYNWDGLSPNPEVCYYRIDMANLSGT